jgi:hypothetical protein
MTLSFPDWKNVRVAPAVFEVAVQTAKPGLNKSR